MLPMIRKHSYLPSSVDEFFGKDLLQDFFATPSNYNMPAVNISENKDGFRIDVAAPGMSKEDFSVIDKTEKLLTNKLQNMIFLYMDIYIYYKKIPYKHLII